MKSVYWVQANKKTLFFNMCLKKRTQAPNAPASKIGSDKYILRTCYVYVYITVFESLTKCIKNFPNDSVFMLAQKMK